MSDSVSESRHLLSSLRKKVKYLKKMRLLMGVESVSCTGSADCSGSWCSKPTMVLRQAKSSSRCSFSLCVTSNDEYWPEDDSGF